MHKLHRFHVLPSLPTELAPLLDLARNLWWTWNPEARALFERLRVDDRPANADPDAMLASVLREVSTAPVPRSSSSASILARLALGALSLGLIAGGAWLVTDARNEAAARRAATVRETATRATRPPPPLPPSPVPGEGGATEHRVSVAEPVTAPSVTIAPVIAPQAPSRVVRSPSSHTARRDPPPVVPAAPAPVASQVIAPVETGDGLLGEIRLLHEAQSALAAHDPTRALARLDEHAARYPHGTLRQESLAERIVALCQLGRANEARALAAPLLRENTRSPAIERVRASCVGNTATP
jgi:hypothetical protein